MVERIPSTAPARLKKAIVATLIFALVFSVMALPAQASMPVLPEIPADRAFNVHLTVDGQIITVEATHGYSVANVLALAGILLTEEEQAGDFLYGPVSPDQVIRLARGERDATTVREEVPARNAEVPTSLLPAGQRLLISEGTGGLVDRTYSPLLVDGRVIGWEILAEEVIEAATVGRVLVGTPGARISPLDFEWERCEDGKPINYARMLPGQRAAGYSDRVGHTTSTGRPVAVGYVAVNPNVIPYGSLLYITSPDGSFVYGYAIAADTGGSLMRGVIGVDLFHASHTEAMLNAMRTVDIYILQLPS